MKQDDPWRVRFMDLGWIDVNGIIWRRTDGTDAWYYWTKDKKLITKAYSQIEWPVDGKPADWKDESTKA